MELQLVLLVILGVTSSFASYPPHNQCYSYQDHAAKYRLKHDKSYYPENEINLVLAQHPYMKDMFHKDDIAHPSVNNNPYVKPLASVCPYHRYTLYSFFYANKDCYVIYPEVQKVTYVQCSSDYNRNCQQCTYHGGVSKCDEDYEYRDVWAYCTYKVTPQVHPQPYPKPVPVVYPRTKEPVHPQPTYPVQPKVKYPYPSTYSDPWNQVYKPYVLNHRWRRSYHQPQPKQYGKIERMPLYLPHHCGCKTYAC